MVMSGSLRESAHGFCRGGLAARALGAGRFARHETIAAAVARHQQQERLQILVDAQPQGVVDDGGVRLDLPPFTVLAQAPVFVHDVPLSPFWMETAKGEQQSCRAAGRYEAAR